ncbi:metallophosphoesterase [Halosquirtibacter laminarini]|uniref:Metallophosphoesterase n=1 Tax=Halosquirtibacter laminarini TaxID=3374600 RepID=A0AC61NI62_9BACT|nr:metallophosphoesterase [Prolixibacteraceae bacterium]
MKRRDFITKTLCSGLALSLSSCRSNSPQGTCTFGLVTDVHYADRDPKLEWNRYYRNAFDKFKIAIDYFNTHNPNFAICLGDIKDQKKQPTLDSTLSFLEKIENVFSLFRGNRYHALGNHDLDSISKTQFLDRVTNTGIDKNQSYYSFDVNNIHFIVLDSCFRQDGVPYDSGNFQWFDASIPSEELLWLEKDLNQTRYPSIVFVHHPLDDFNLPDKRISISNAGDVRSILEKNDKVKAVFQGHHHDGNYCLHNNIHYYTMKSVVDGPIENNYALVSVDMEQSKISIQGKGDTDSVDFALI